ncbi:hypothetical protein MKW94_006253 [Papaver nudicaule]|uniref:Phytocyanin domain-containing protein n=1 Tax=Papaver nudicaule TaxID=74823 RepID=A0AA41SL53_PAPNU|nr:hypothetical protein [Papaver nudicaule]
MLNLRTLMSLAVTALFIQSAIGAKHAVGGPDGEWNQVTNFTTWAKGERFEVGDTLEFTYNAAHSVLEVNEKAYDDCDTSSPITIESSGTTSITLSSVGKRFFICGTSGHCENDGMKVTIDTVSSTTPSTPTTPSKPDPADSPADPPTKPEKTRNAGNGGYEVNLAMLLGFGLMSLMFL